MGITMRLLVTLAMVGLVAGPVQAHTIAVRDGGGSTNLCSDSEGDGLLDQWVSLEFELEGEDGDPAGTESISNNCGARIYSLDLQLSENEDGDPLSHLSDFPEVGEDSIFDTIVPMGDFFRFFSSQQNSIDCVGCSVDLIISSEFLFVVNTDTGLPPFGYFRIVDFGIEPLQAVPEPASLLLLGSGLVGVALKWRRRANPRL